MLRIQFVGAAGVLSKLSLQKIMLLTLLQEYPMMKLDRTKLLTKFYIKEVDRLNEIKGTDDPLFIREDEMEK
jgi:hypothetical protein